MKVRTVTINGKYFDSIQKAIDENDPDRDRKSYYLFGMSGLNSRATSCYNFCYQARDDADKKLRNILDTKFDYRTITYRQFAKSMGIDYDKLDLPADADVVYDNARRRYPNAKESELKHTVMSEFSSAFAQYFVTQGEDAEAEEMTEEQKRLYRLGQTAGQRAENLSEEGIEEWIANEGEQIGEDLRTAAVLPWLLSLLSVPYHPKTAKPPVSRRFCCDSFCI